MNYTSITLGELLSSENETIKRNAISILKVLQKEKIVLPDINDAQHPMKQKAIAILEEVQTYLCPKCVKNTDGENWYALEDKITSLINR